MQREKRYLVLKLKDVDASLTAEECGHLDALCNIVAEHREAAGKRPLMCVVVEDDWPEYDPVWKMIEERMDGKPPTVEKPTCEECVSDGGPCAHPGCNGGPLCCNGNRTFAHQQYERSTFGHCGPEGKLFKRRTG